MNKQLEIEEVHLMKLVGQMNTAEELHQYRLMLHEILADIENKEYKLIREGKMV